MFNRLYDKDGQIPFIRKLCADLDESEIRRAEANYVRFLELTWEIFEEAGFDFADEADSPNR